MLQNLSTGDLKSTVTCIHLQIYTKFLNLNSEIYAKKVNSNISSVLSQNAMAK